MNILNWLQRTKKLLQHAAIPTSELDAEVLLADTLQKDRSWIHAHLAENILDHISGLNLVKLDERVQRRVQHEPIAYIRGIQEFFGRGFEVTPGTLTALPG